MRISRDKIILLSGLIGIFTLAWQIQQLLFLNWDVSMLMNASRQWLNGGTYLNNFFTPNPPMILYLYGPPVILSKFFNVDIIIIFRIYIFAITSLSLFISYQLTKHIFVEKNKRHVFVFVMILATVFLLLPFYQFGQRDHLFAIMIMPYVLLIVYKLQNNAIKPAYAILIGIFAGLGVGIKPQFLFTPILIEIYYIVQQRSWLSWTRPETMALMGILIAYMVVVFMSHQDYLFIVVPYMMDFYYKNLSVSWIILAFNDIILYCLFSMVFYFVLYKERTYKILSNVLFLALIGCLLSYYTQHSSSYYHIIPAYSFAIVLVVLLFDLLTAKYQHVFMYFAGFCIFVFPVFAAYQLYMVGMSFKKNTLDTLIAFMRTQAPHQSIYSISEANYSSPLIHYTDATAAQRFDCLWMVEYLIRMRDLQGDGAVRRYLKNDSNLFFLNMVADDLRRYKPDLVFVDVTKINTWLSRYYTYFDYLDYFLENKQFRNEWTSYHYLTTIVGGKQYKLQVYKRVYDKEL